MATNLNVKFLRGAQASLPTTGTDGYFYLTVDTHRLYTSIDGKVVPVNEGVVTVANLDALTSVTGAQAGDFFYCTEENILAVFNGQKFVQINPDTGMTSVAFEGEGNAITDASYDPATRKLTLTKGETFATKAYVGEIPETATATDIVGYIQEKTSGIATSDNLEELTERVATAEGEIDALQEASAKHVEKVEGKSLVTDTEITKLAGVSEGANKTEKSETNGNIKIDGEEVVVYTHPEKHAIADVTGLEDRLAAIEGNFGEGEGTVESKIEAAVSAETEAREEAVKGVQDEVDALETKVGEIPEGATATTVVGYVDEKVAAETKAREDAVKGVQDAVDAMYTNDQIDTAVQGAKDYAKDLVDAIPAQTDYTVTITENTDDTTVAKTYVFTQNGAEIGSIKLAKELVVTSGSVKEVETADAPYAGAKVGEKYIELVIANQETPIYVPAKDLVDIYTAKDGATEVQVAISNTNEISATLVNGGITEEKLAEGVKTKLNKVWEEVGVAAGLVSALENGQVKTNTEAIENITKEGGLIATAESNAKTYAEEKASAAQSAAEAKVTELAGNTYTKEQTFTKDEVNAAIEEAVAEACSWGSFGE